MAEETHTIRDSPGDVLDCACIVETSQDGETIGHSFPQLAYEGGIGPMVYLCMDGTDLTVRIGSTEDSEWSFAYSESDRRWLLREKPNKDQLR